MSCYLKSSSGIPTVRPSLAKSTPGLKTFVKTMENLIAEPSDNLTDKVMKSMTAAVEELKEAVEKQTAALLLAPVSVSLPLSMQEVAALARREEELVKVMRENMWVSMRLENKVVMEGTTGDVEEAKTNFRNFLEDAMQHVDNDEESVKSHKEDMLLSKGGRKTGMFGLKEAKDSEKLVSMEAASAIKSLLVTERKDCSYQKSKRVQSEDEIETETLLSVDRSMCECDRVRNVENACTVKSREGASVTRTPSHGAMICETLSVLPIEARRLQINKSVVIKATEIDTATRINVVFYTGKCGGKSSVEIRGSERDVKSARQKIEKAISEVKMETILVTGSEAKFLCMNKVEVLRAIRVETETFIDVYGIKNDNERSLVVTGSEQAVVKAKLKIKDILARLQFMTFLVSRDEAGFLLRNQAKIIKDIQDKIGAHIDITGSKSESQKSLLIVGHSEGPEEAKKKIEVALKRKLFKALVL